MTRAADKEKSRKNKRGNPAGPPERGRRGHSTVKRQKGFEKWLENLLAQEPDITYDELALRVAAETRFKASKSALNRWGLQRDRVLAESRTLLAIASEVSIDDPEQVLTLQKAATQLATLRGFRFLLGRDGPGISEDEIEVHKSIARLTSSSATAERAQAVVHGKYEQAKRAIESALHDLLRADPMLAKRVLANIEKAFKKVAK